MIPAQSLHAFEISAGKAPISSFKLDINHWTFIHYVLITSRWKFIISVPCARATFCSTLQLSKLVISGSVCSVVINSFTGSLDIILWNGVSDIITEWWIKVKNHTLHFLLKSSYFLKVYYSCDTEQTVWINTEMTYNKIELNIW